MAFSSAAAARGAIAAISKLDVGTQREHSAACAARGRVGDHRACAPGFASRAASCERVGHRASSSVHTTGWAQIIGAGRAFGGPGQRATGRRRAGNHADGSRGPRHAGGADEPAVPAG
jgi:hypothetical protein